MKIGQLNIRSINNKIDSIKSIFIEHNIDLLCLQETWLKDDFNFMNSNKFKVYNKIRTDGYGGVAIVCRSKTIASEIPITCENIETVILEIRLQPTTIKYAIVNIYIKPNIKIENLKNQ